MLTASWSTVGTQGAISQRPNTPLDGVPKCPWCPRTRPSVGVLPAHVGVVPQQHPHRLQVAQGHGQLQGRPATRVCQLHVVLEGWRGHCPLPVTPQCSPCIPRPGAPSPLFSQCCQPDPGALSASRPFLLQPLIIPVSPVLPVPPVLPVLPVPSQSPHHSQSSSSTPSSPKCSQCCHPHPVLPAPHAPSLPTLPPVPPVPCDPSAPNPPWCFQSLCNAPSLLPELPVPCVPSLP